MSNDGNPARVPAYLNIVGTEPLVYHCHHYNLTLQESIEDARKWVDADAILVDGAEIAASAMLRSLASQKSPKDSFAIASEHFRLQGFGLLDCSGVGADGGSATVHNSHYALGHRQRKPDARREAPVCYFAAGYIAAAAAAAHGRPPGSYRVRETECVALGADACVFQVEARQSPRALEASIGQGRTGDPMPPAPAGTPPSAIDEPAVIQAVGSLSLVGNEEGQIPAFGVLLSQHFANYYNYISYETERAVAHDEVLQSATRALLVEAGHVCAFNTFGGIMRSAEWDAVVGPMIGQRTDWVYGIVAVINALGWGRWAVEEIVENERLVVRVDSSYESNYHLARYDLADSGKCYLPQGGVAGIMNLLYVGDITEKPELTAEYYAKLFSSPESFVATETKCRSKGDDYCELVAERRHFD